LARVVEKVEFYATEKEIKKKIKPTQIKTTLDICEKVVVERVMHPD